MVIFFFISLTFNSWQPTKWKRFSFSHLFICLFKPEWTKRIFYSMEHNSSLSLLILISNCPRFAQWLALQTGFYILLICPYHFLHTSLLPDIKLPFILILCFCCHSPEISHFFLDLFNYQWKIVSRNQDLHAEYAYCYGLLQFPGTLSAQNYNGTEIHLYSYYYLPIYLSTSLPPYLSIQVHNSTSNSVQTQYHRVHYPSPFLYF